MDLNLDLSFVNKAFQNLKTTEVKTDGGNEKKPSYYNLRIGFHTSKDNHSGLIEPLEIDHKELSKYFKRTAAQIFTQIPQTTAFIKMEDPGIITDFAHKKDMKLIIHTPYAMNDFWKSGDLTKLNVSLDNAKKFMYNQANQLIKQLDGMVVHLPKLNAFQVADVISNRSTPEVTILLENHAYKPDDGSYELPSKLNKLTEELNKAKVQNWGYCIDTAHLFVQISRADREIGYKIETLPGMSRWLNELTTETREKIKCWHLNGSMNPASSYDDKHAIPVFGLNHKLKPIPNPTGKAKAKDLEAGYCRDYMWGDLLMKEEIINDGIDSTLSDQIEALEDSSLIPILKHAMHYDIPVILEINRGNEDDVQGCLKVFAALEKNILADKY